MFVYFQSMLSLELQYFLFHFVAPFNGLRGHRWERVSDGSNHGRVVIGGEMQSPRAHGGTAELDSSPNIWTETCPESELVAEIAG
mgnify:CR=1 FL=1